jgi:ribosomal protein L19
MATRDFTVSPIDMDTREKLDVRAGDTVRVWQKITERYMEKDKVKEKTRSQAFEGLECICIKRNVEDSRKWQSSHRRRRTELNQKQHYKNK